MRFRKGISGDQDLLVQDSSVRSVLLSAPVAGGGHVTAECELQYPAQGADSIEHSFPVPLRQVFLIPRGKGPKKDDHAGHCPDEIKDDLRPVAHDDMFAQAIEDGPSEDKRQSEGIDPEEDSVPGQDLIDHFHVHLHVEKRTVLLVYIIYLILLFVK